MSENAEALLDPKLGVLRALWCWFEGLQCFANPDPIQEADYGSKPEFGRGLGYVAPFTVLRAHF